MAISRPTEPMIRRPIRVPAFVIVWVMTPKPQAQAARPVPIGEARITRAPSASGVPGALQRPHDER